MRNKMLKSLIPMSAEHVAAGFPSPAEGYLEKPLDLNEHLVEHPSATFFVKAGGESMTGVGIFPGDLLIVDRALTPVNGSVVIAVIDSEFTVKSLHLNKDGAELRPENPAFKTVKVTEENDFQIWGVVTYVIHTLLKNKHKGK